MIARHLLSIVLFTPLIGALVLLAIPKRREDAIRWIANIFATAGFLVSLPLWFWYEPGRVWIELVPQGNGGNVTFR